MYKNKEELIVNKFHQILVCAVDVHFQADRKMEVFNKEKNL